MITPSSLYTIAFYLDLDLPKSLISLKNEYVSFITHAFTKTHFLLLFWVDIRSSRPVVFSPWSSILDSIMYVRGLAERDRKVYSKIIKGQMTAIICILAYLLSTASSVPPTYF
jgi:hypothetical protein